MRKWWPSGGANTSSSSNLTSPSNAATNSSVNSSNVNSASSPQHQADNKATAAASPAAAVPMDAKDAAKLAVIKQNFCLSTEPKPGFLGNLDEAQYSILLQLRELYAGRVEHCLDGGGASTLAYCKSEETSLYQVLSGRLSCSFEGKKAHTLATVAPPPSSPSSATAATATTDSTSAAAALELQKKKNEQTAKESERRSSGGGNEETLGKEEGDKTKSCDAAYSNSRDTQTTVEKTTHSELSELDCFLLRFLRARNFDITKTSLMLDNYLKWRVSFRVEEICNTVRFPWVTALRLIYPHGYHGVDKTGRPIYIERLGKADTAAALKIASIDLLLAYWVQQYEYVRRVILPACSIVAGRRIEQGVSIIDLSGLGFSHCGGQTRSMMKKIATLSQDYYPEMLGAMVVVNAPAAFGPVWSFARTLIDERTVAKITLLTSRSQRWRQYLQELADPDQLPAFLGGTAPNEGWDTNKGPWNDLNILKQLEKRNPSIPKSFLYFDLQNGNPESLKLLEGLPDSVSPTASVAPASVVIPSTAAAAAVTSEDAAAAGGKGVAAGDSPSAAVSDSSGAEFVDIEDDDETQEVDEADEAERLRKMADEGLEVIE